MDTTTDTAEEMATQIVNAIRKDLTSRSGFDAVWADCDMQTRSEIYDAWLVLVRRHTGATPAPPRERT